MRRILLGLKRRAFVLGIGVAATYGGALVVIACSTSDPVTADGDDASPTSEGGSSSGGDAKADGPGSNPDGGGPKGNCSEVKGPCDIVAQDCPNDAKGKRQECVTALSGGKYTTQCIPEQASQILEKGAACCPGTDTNPCLPGLQCLGSPCQDGGPPTGRCSPACCQGDDQACDRSKPEGIAGACDIQLVGEGNVNLNYVCSYRERCKPFRQEPCKDGQACLIDDKTGAASCETSFGKKRGESCSFKNECADGMMCVGAADAGTCRWMCLTPNSTHPFDAGVENGGAGMGGCPVNEKCIITLDPASAPAWLSLCAFPDGG